MNEIIPRYEFRAFAQNFGLATETIRALAPCEEMRESLDVYLITVVNDKNNVKMRGGQTDVKVLVQEEEGLEQWRPQLKEELPLSTALLRDEILPALKVDVPTLSRSTYTMTQLLQELATPHTGITAVHVFKRRFRFTVNGCMTEIARLLVNGAAISTVAVESEDVTAVLEAKDMLHLQPYQNVNYLLALKRITGLKPLPDTYWRAK